MKTVLCKTIFLFLTIILIVPNTFFAKAQSSKNYYRVITEDANFYESSSMQSTLFYLQYTYYVNVIAEVGELYQIEVYGGENSPSFIGYTKKENLYKDDFEITSPYPNASVKTCCSTILYNDTNYLNKQVYLFPERSFTYYGKNYDSVGNVLYLIGYEDKVGYVKESSLYPFSIDNHPNELTFLKKEPVEQVNGADTEIVEDNTKPKTDENTLLKVGIICSLIVAGGLGLYVVLRKKEHPQRKVSYYDENEYE